VSDAGAVQQQLEVAAQRRAERDRLTQRLTELRGQVDLAAAQVASKREALSVEERDVARLESFSPTRIWASLRDTRATDLDRERAERDRAHYEVAAAEATHGALARDAAALEVELASFGDADEGYLAALAAKDEWVRASGAPGAAELVAIADERGVVAAQDKELMDAARAAVEAAQLFAAAEDRLGRAMGWSNWDAFGGGGLLTDMMKYDRIDEAVGVLRRADQALRKLSQELADVGLQAVASADVRGLAQTFDVWFDNIFSDLSVRSRVTDAYGSVRRVQAQLGELMPRLEAQVRAGEEKLRELDRRREALLAGG
jgi:hypothetical protein